MKAHGALNRHLPIPLYYQLKTVLMEQIRAGELKPHDCLPSEEKLAQSYGVSKATVRQALNELAVAGIIRREQGRGTYVADPKVELGPKELTSFTNEMRRHGLRPMSKVLKKEIVSPEADVAEKLELQPGRRVVRLKRLRFADGEPMGIQTAYLPSDLVPGLINEDLESASLYAVLERKYRLQPSHARETHFAVLVGRQDARLLRIEEGAPGMAAERLTFLGSNRPFELVYSVMRGDRYKVVLNLRKSRG